MDLKKQVQQWANNISKDKCKNCCDNCCNCKKHAICLLSRNLGPFEEAGIPILGIDELGPLAEYMFLNHIIKAYDLRTKRGSLIPIPAIVQCTRQNNSDKEMYEIYSNGFCPLYINGKCSIHEDPRRPDTCKDYPVLVDPELRIGTFLSSCKGFRDLEVQRAFKKEFPEIPIIQEVLFSYRVARAYQLSKREEINS